MKKTTLVATIALTLLAPCLTTVARSQPSSPPGNDYGVVSEEVARQRLLLAGHTEINKLVKTATGYEATTMKDGRQHILVIDGTRGHITENGIKLRLPAVEMIRLQLPK